MLNILIGIALVLAVAFAIHHGTRGKGGSGAAPTKTMLTPEQMDELQKNGSLSISEKK